MQLSILEREIHTGPHHPKIILWTVNKVPTEVTDPADVRSQTDFEPAANLTNSFCLALGVKIFEVLCFARYINISLNVAKRIPFTAAKDRAAATENVGRKARAVERITQGQRAEDGTHRARLVAAPGEESLRPVLNLVEIQDTSSGTGRPAFNTDTD